MAMADSVTVSMAAESRGIRRGIEGVSQVEISTASGVTSNRRVSAKYHQKLKLSLGLLNMSLTILSKKNLI